MELIKVSHRNLGYKRKNLRFVSERGKGHGKVGQSGTNLEYRRKIWV